MMQVRSSFVREAALLLADLAEQPGRGRESPAAGFLEALAASLDTPSDNNAGQNSFETPFSLPNSPFLAQLDQEIPQTLPPAELMRNAFGAYAQRMSQGMAYEGLYWPVDMNV